LKYCYLALKDIGVCSFQ